VIDGKPTLVPLLLACARRWRSLGVGAALLVLLAALEQADPGFSISFQPPYTSSSKGELFFWLTHSLLGLPASMLLGHGLAPLLGPLLQGLRALSRRRHGAVVLGALVATGSFLTFVVLRSIILLDTAVTDDENAVAWGGQVLASGRIGVPVPAPVSAFRGPFQMFRGGLLMSYDWPGGLLFSALTRLTGLGSKGYAVMAATSAPLLALAAFRLWGRSAALVAGGWALCSPAFLLLSLTTHAQLLSRSLTAAAVAALAVTLTGGSRLAAGAAGLLLGLSFLTRPIETSVLALPFVLRELAEALRLRRAPWPRWASLAAGFTPALLIFGAFNHATTGVAWLPGRFTPEAAAGSPALPFLGYWDRLGEGVGYSALMLALFAVGPPGFLAVGAALPGGRREPAGFSAALAASLAMGLLLSMAHDNFGVHGVGPIHQAETSVPLLLLAARGVTRIGTRLRLLGARRASLAAVMACYLTLGQGSFSVVYLGALHRQALAQLTPYTALQRTGIRRAVVLAPRLRDAYELSPELAVGSWVRHWAPWPPDFATDLLILRDLPGALEAVLRLFPDRPVYRLSFAPPPPGDRHDIVRLEQLAPGGS
jgi:hypothetical protein